MQSFVQIITLKKTFTLIIFFSRTFNVKIYVVDIRNYMELSEVMR